MTHGFLRTALYLWSALLTWMGAFVFIYVFAAVACARQFASMQVIGMEIVPFVTTLSSVVAAAATFYFLWTAYHRMRATADEHSRFIQFVVLASSVLALIGLLYLTLPPIVLASDCDIGA